MWKESLAMLRERWVIKERQGHGGPDMVTWLGPHVRVESFILCFLAETQFSYLCTRGKPSVRPSQPEGMVAEPLIQLCEQCQVCGRGQSCLPWWLLTHPFIIASGSEFIFVKILSPRLQKLLDKAAWWLESGLLESAMNSNFPAAVS